MKILLGVWFWSTKKTTRHVLTLKKYASDFKENFTTTCQIFINFLNKRQILNWLFNNVSYWVYVFCSSPSFHVFIKTGHVSVMF